MSTKNDDCINDYYRCDFCDYNTSHRGHWKKHIDTNKHKLQFIASLQHRYSQKMTTPYSRNVCLCGKQYSHSASLYRHKATCKYIDETLKKIADGSEVKLPNYCGSSPKNTKDKQCENEQTKTLTDAKDDIEIPQSQSQKLDIENMKVCSVNNRSTSTTTPKTDTIIIDKKTFELMEENSRLKDSMINVLKQKPNIVSNGDNTHTVINNTNHNTLNINVYLDEKYKEAMNIGDFVQNIQCSVDDLLTTANQGYVKGVSNIFLKNLKIMDPKSRPIHCGDLKGTQIYIRDANRWEKDKGKLNTEIDNVAKKQITMMSEWEKMHPNWHKDEKLTHQYLNLVRQLTATNNDDGNEQIKRNVAKTVVLEDIISQQDVHVHATSENTDTRQHT